MNLWLIIPVKPFGQGKSRLADHLSASERGRLSAQLLAHVLDVAGTVEELAGILVVSRDEKVLVQAEAAGALALSEAPTTGKTAEEALNQAVAQATQAARQQGAHAVLILPADLPLLAAADVRTFYQRAQTLDRGVVLAPSQDNGTNGLLLRPPDAIPFAFGPNSFQRHRELANAAGLPVQVVESPRLALDVDFPADLALLRTDKEN